LTIPIREVRVLVEESVLVMIPILEYSYSSDNSILEDFLFYDDSYSRYSYSRKIPFYKHSYSRYDSYSKMIPILVSIPILEMIPILVSIPILEMIPIL
ncbi:hypothetical protein L9F63_020313, partial [Diploptera punctata]